MLYYMEDVNILQPRKSRIDIFYGQRNIRFIIERATKYFSFISFA